MKTCTKCSLGKELTEFYKNTKGYLLGECKECSKERIRLSKIKNKEKNKETRRVHYEKNKEKIQIQNKEWALNNREVMNSSAKKYRDNNRDKINAYEKEYRKEYVKNNPIELVKRRLRNRTGKVFRLNKYKKNGTTESILGASYEEVMKKIESLFVEGMNWENRRLWHIDHIIPLDSATTEEELIKLCHYSNLQPLWEKDNLEKSNKIY